MSSHHKNETELPGWLWFFLILPLGLAVALLYQRKRLPQLVQRMRSLPKSFRPTPRYVEPDSIPLEIRPIEPAEIAEADITPGPEEIPLTRMEAVDAAVSSEEAADAEAADAETADAGTEPTPQQPADLKIIEGIGPSIANLLNQAGITTFHQLANTSVERLSEILAAARLSHLAAPDTWPEQARLAEKGQWDELKQLQGQLNRGRRQNQE